MKKSADINPVLKNYFIKIIAFLFLWVVVLNEIGLFGFVAMIVFLGILVVGFIYEWTKGALEWD